MSSPSSNPTHDPADVLAAAAAVSADDDVALADLGKIREILFGAQTRNTETRIAALEDRMRRDAEHLRRRLDDLEKLIHTSVESLGDRIKALRSETLAAQGNAATEARQAAGSLKLGLVGLEERVERERKEIRVVLLEQVEALRENIRQHHADAIKVVELQGERLQTSKIDRHSLGELLADLATRVSR